MYVINAAKPDTERGRRWCHAYVTINVTSGASPGGAAAKTVCSQCRAPRFDPWPGNETPRAATKNPVCLQHTELCSGFCGSLDRSGVWGRVGLTEPHTHTPHTHAPTQAHTHPTPTHRHTPFGDTGVCS